MRYCSSECQDKLIRKINTERYGVEIGSQSIEARKKLSKASLASMDKRKETCMSRYGVPYTSQVPEIRAKITKSVNSPEYRQKLEAQYLAKYGVTNPAQLPEIHVKQKNSEHVAPQGWGRATPSWRIQPDPVV